MYPVMCKMLTHYKMCMEQDHMKCFQACPKNIQTCQVKMETDSLKPGTDICYPNTALFQTSSVSVVTVMMPGVEFLHQTQIWSSTGKTTKSYFPSHCEWPRKTTHVPYLKYCQHKTFDD